ncbi:MAG: hypothetical protein EXS36_03300 [Pedosphaera sp.]|nr:hypothetical protein [Pedosphaera sp.]
MKTTLQFAAVLAIFAAVSILQAGDVTGKVTLKGDAPAEKEITPLAKDPNCGKSYSKPATTRHYVVGADKGLANVFVYVKKGLEGKTFPAPAEKPVMDQKACLYQPYVLGARAGHPVVIKSSDDFMHNVNFAASKTGNDTFNFAQTKAGQANEKIFKNVEVLAKLQCNVHPWMFGYIGVVDSPYYGVTDASGKYTIAGLPDGKYTLAFVHLKAGEVLQEFDVKGGASVNATLEVK